MLNKSAPEWSLARESLRVNVGNESLADGPLRTLGPTANSCYVSPSPSKCAGEIWTLRGADAPPS